jgi:hypothetical protein
LAQLNLLATSKRSSSTIICILVGKSVLSFTQYIKQSSKKSPTHGIYACQCCPNMELLVVDLSSWLPLPSVWVRGKHDHFTIVQTCLVITYQQELQESLRELQESHPFCSPWAICTKILSCGDGFHLFLNSKVKLLYTNSSSRK